MATIKSYTDIEQSRKLAEFLPIESADTYWSRCTITDFGDDKLKVSYAVEPCNISKAKHTKDDIPCWSLAALLEVYPMTVGKDIGMYCCWQNYHSLCSRHYDNPVDACYEMILKLHELKML